MTAFLKVLPKFQQKYFVIMDIVIYFAIIYNANGIILLVRCNP